MASPLNEIVEVILYRGSTPIETASFSIPLIISTHTKFPERTRQYSSMDSVAEDFDVADPAYQVAQALYGQTGVLGAPISTLIIGRRQIDEAVVGVVGTVASGNVYSITVNSKTYSYTAGGVDTASSVASGIAAAYALAPVAGINLVVGTDVATVEVGPAVLGTGWALSSSVNLEVVSTVSLETWTDAYDAVKADNSTFYAVFIDTHDAAVVEEVSDAVATDRRVFGTATQDAAVIDSASITDIAYVLSNKNAARTYGVYSATADEDFPEAAWAGSQLAVTPGSNDWDYKRANNITRSNLTANQINVLRDKNTNFFTRVAGVDVFRDGNMFNGGAIDLIIAEDWLVARLQEGVYFRLINSLKIPMTNIGLTIIENEIRAVLSQAEANGMIDRGWTVTTPDVLAIPENLRAQRIAGAFRFDARLQGSVRQVKSITGYLTV